MWLTFIFFVLVAIWIWSKREKEEANPPGQLKIEVRYENHSD